MTITAALPVALRTNPTLRFGGVCLLFIGVTAGVGAARFFGLDVALFHESMSWTSRTILVPALGPVFLALSFGRKIIRPYWYAICLGLGALGWALPPALALVPGVIAMLMIAFVAARHFASDRRLALGAALGVVLMTLAGLAVGTEGHLGPIPRLDLFHYMLAIAHIGFADALRRAEAVNLPRKIL